MYALENVLGDVQQRRAFVGPVKHKAVHLGFETIEVHAI